VLDAWNTPAQRSNRVSEPYTIRLNQLRNVAGGRSTNGAIRSTAAFNDNLGSCSRASTPVWSARMGCWAG
jgi:hypothetical protein